MAKLIREFDWSQTPLGPIADWSPELLTIVNLTLCSPAPARTLWGPNYILIYNDAYRNLPGVLHPALGQPAQEIYRDTWHLLGPYVEQAFASGETCFAGRLTMPLEAEPGPSSKYLNHSFHPVFEQGSVGGLFNPLEDVTAEANTSSRLRDSEARANLILQSIGDAVIVTDRDGRITHMNPLAERLTGWPTAEAEGLPVHEVFQVIDEKTRKAIQSPTDKVMSLGLAVGAGNHAILIRRDGTETEIEDSGVPLEGEHGKLEGMVLVFRDVGPRKAAERQRDSVAGSLNQFLETTTDGVLCLDRDWRITYINPRASAALAVSGPLRGRNFWEAFPATIYPGSPYVEHYHNAMENRVSARFEEYYPTPLDAWFSVIVEPSGDGIILFFRDVTEQRREAAALRESEGRLRAMYSAGLEYIGLLTPDGILLHCNDASLEFAGNTREELTGKHFADCPWWSNTPGASDRVREWIARAAQGECIRVEASLVRPNGETIVFDFSLTPSRDQEGRIVYLVPEARDISELKRAEAALIQSEKLAAVGRLASSIAHEINNPLESVTNLIYLAQQSSENESTRQYLELAEQEIARISIIANQTLRFHRQPSKPRPVSGSDLFSTVLGIYENKLRSAGIEVERRLVASSRVVCMEGDIRQVLNNLVSNAIDAMPRGGRLVVRSREGTDWRTGRRGLVLTVADTGEGMSAQTTPRIFEPFFTTKGMSGTGLGLWVSKEIVERHQGSLRVHSSRQPGHSGTVFSLFLPFDANDAAQLRVA